MKRINLNSKEKQIMGKIFDEFMKSYLDNVTTKLKWSQRAKQLFNGGIEAQLVLDTETILLIEPFVKAYKTAYKNGLEKNRVGEKNHANRKRSKCNILR